MEGFPLNDVMNGVYTNYADWFATECRANDITIVEVGSGDGRVAKWFLDRGCKVICVDPEPASYYNDGRAIVTPPDFKHVKDVSVSLIETCALVLIRPTPCLGYDLEALNHLKPRMMFSVYQADGADGSVGLHRWLGESQRGYK
jgi:hypothetical protein